MFRLTTGGICGFARAPMISGSSSLSSGAAERTACVTALGRFFESSLPWIEVRMVIAIIPPRNRTAAAKVPAVPSRGDGTDKVVATTRVWSQLFESLSFDI